jgi:YfiH family protein
VDDNKKTVARNRRFICKNFDLEPDHLISAHQTHSKNVMVFGEEAERYHTADKEYENIDALVTNMPGTALMVKVADCQAIVMFDPVQKVIAVVHAGWKGLAQDVSGAAIRLMKRQFKVKPENLFVGISPSLGPCCAFFTHPEKELPPEFSPYIHTNKTVDLWSFSTEQLKKHGIQPEHIELARVCTMCGAGGKFFSFRRDRGMTGRFGALLFLKK